MKLKNYGLCGQIHHVLLNLNTRLDTTYSTTLTDHITDELMQ